MNKIKEDKKVQNTKISSVKISSRKIVKAFKYKISVTNVRGLYAKELDNNIIYELKNSEINSTVLKIVQKCVNFNDTLILNSWAINEL